MPKIRSECLYFGTIPKPGENEENCQDACSVDKDGSRFAIADGVTKSFLPAQWAQLLVESFTTDSSERIDELFSKQDWKSWLLPIQVKWEVRAKEIISDLRESKYVYMRNQYTTKEPAAATFIGLREKQGSNGCIWQIMIIGDSCLFHITKESKIYSYLLDNQSQFDSRPNAFASYKGKTVGEPEFLEISVKEGDRVLLATDALSKWLLSVRERNNNAYIATLKLLTQFRNKEDLLRFAEIERSDKTYPLESDDVGMVSISFRGLVETKANSQKLFNSDNVLPNSSTFVLKPVMSNQQIQTQNQSGESNPRFFASILVNPETTTGYKTKKIYLWLLGITAVVSILVIGYWYYSSNYVSDSPELVMPNGYVIPAGVSVLHEPKLDAPIIFTSIKDFAVVIMDNKIDGWMKIEITAWLKCEPTFENVGVFVLTNPQTAYMSNSSRSDVIGTIPSGIPLAVVEQYLADDHVWCKTIFQGYVISNVGGSNGAK